MSISSASDSSLRVMTPADATCPGSKASDCPYQVRRKQKAFHLPRPVDNLYHDSRNCQMAGQKLQQTEGHPSTSMNGQLNMAQRVSEADSELLRLNSPIWYQRSTRTLSGMLPALYALPSGERMKDSCNLLTSLLSFFCDI